MGFRVGINQLLGSSAALFSGPASVDHIDFKLGHILYFRVVGCYTTSIFRGEFRWFPEKYKRTFGCYNSESNGQIFQFGGLQRS